MQVMKKIVVGMVMLLAVMALGPASAAVAQSDVVIDELIVRVWPEFDSQSALVFLIGSVESDAELTITLPDDIKPFAVAYEDSLGGLSNIGVTTQVGNTLTLTTQNGNFHIEFYDPSFSFDGNTRSYALDYTTNHEIRRLVWGIQLPPGSDEESLTAFEEGNFTSDQFGLTVYEGIIENVEAGSIIPISYSYERVMAQFTNDILLQSSEATADDIGSSAAPAQTDGLPWWAIIVIVILTLVLLALGVMYFVNNRYEAVPAPSITSPTSKKKSSRSSSGGRRFCTNCGQPVDPDDVFCRHCGHRLA